MKKYCLDYLIDLNKKIIFFAKGYHKYKGLWKPVINEQLTTEMEPYNIAKKQAVCVKKNNIIVDLLPLGKNGKFTKAIFYLLSTDIYAEFKVIITGKKVNLGDGKGMQWPCLLEITGTKNMEQTL